MPNEAAFIRQLDALIDSREWNNRPHDEVDNDLRLIVYRSLEKYIDGMPPLPDPDRCQDAKYYSRPKPPIPVLLGQLFGAVETHYHGDPIPAHIP